MYESSRTIKRK